jgi:TonB family protein
MTPMGAAADPSASPACPVTLGTLQLTGITSDQTQRRYHAVVESKAKGQLQLALAFIDSHSQRVTRATTTAFDPSTGDVELEVWSAQPLAAVRVERIMRAGVEDVSCDSAASIADADHAQSTITIFARDRDLAAGAVASLYVTRDSRLVNRATPDYPMLAANQGISGTTVVEVTIGPKGTLQRAIVYLTSDSPLLDDAALRAAKSSTFAEPQVNGQPVTRDYVIDYIFQFSDMHQTEPCGAAIGRFHLARDLPQLQATLFDISVLASDTNLASAEVGFYSGQARKGFGVSLPEVVFEAEDSSKALTPVTHASGDARILWMGPRINYADLQFVVGTDGNTRPCHLEAVHALDHDGKPINLGSEDPDPSPARAWLVLPARYERRPFPAYPPSEEAADHGGCADLLVHVDTEGSPDRIETISGSGQDALDQAAIHAASAGKYRLTVRSGVAQTQYYSARYCFSTTKSTP